MARNSLVFLASLTLAASVLAGCGTSNMVGLNPATESSAAEADNIDKWRIRGNEALDEQFTKTLKTYKDLRSAWDRETSEAEKNRLEVRMLGELVSGVDRLMDIINNKGVFKTGKTFSRSDKDFVIDLYWAIGRDPMRKYEDSRYLNGSTAYKIDFIQSRLEAYHKTILEFKSRYTKK